MTGFVLASPREENVDVIPQICFMVWLVGIIGLSGYTQVPSQSLPSARCDVGFNCVPWRGHPIIPTLV